jgi:hypothetical protein
MMNDIGSAKKQDRFRAQVGDINKPDEEGKRPLNARRKRFSLRAKASNGALWLHYVYNLISSAIQLRRQ